MAFVVPRFLWPLRLPFPAISWLRVGAGCTALLFAVEAQADEAPRDTSTLHAMPSNGTAVATNHAPASPVLAWNGALADAVRRACTAPPLASRQFAILHLALDQACREEGAAAVSAIVGEVVLSALFPEQTASFLSLRDSLLTRGAAPSAHQWKRANEIAASALAERDGDGSTRSITYIPASEAGQWRRTPPFFRPPELPQWAQLRPFVLVHPESHVPAGPPRLDSEAWKRDAEEMRLRGGKKSEIRTEEETELAFFWSDFSYTCTPPGHWNEIAVAEISRRQLSEQQAAHILKVLNLAMADAAIVCWKAKYRYNFWRPVTALEAQRWKPLLNTPNHPEYPSGHSAFSGAAAAVLTELFGGDACDVEVRSDAVAGRSRRYHSFAVLAKEIGESRIVGGIHFRFSCVDGLALGESVAREVLAQAGKVPASSLVAR